MVTRSLNFSLERIVVYGEGAMNSVLVLLSGGIDSAALVHYYRSQNTPVFGLHVQYGQPVAEREAQAAKAIAAHYGIELRIAQIKPPLARRGDEYFCRNAILVLIACANLSPGVNRVTLGIHSGTIYYDCSQGFMADMQRLLDGYFSGTVTVEAPFLRWSKLEVYQYCMSHGVPVDLTYSCERNNDKPCGQCPSCYDRRRLYEAGGFMSAKKN